MPYISKEEVKAIREQLKKEFPRFKFSVTGGNDSTLSIALMKGPLDFKDHSLYVNEYHIDKHWEDFPEAHDILLKIKEIAFKNRRIICEDSDYGSIPNYYVDIEIGRWDKPYQKI